MKNRLKTSRKNLVIECEDTATGGNEEMTSEMLRIQKIIEDGSKFR